MADFGDFEDYDEYEDYEDLVEQLPRDKKIDETKEVFLAELFHKNAEKVYYERQIEVIYEKKFFHWISAKALKELAEERAVNTELLHLDNNVPIRFYWTQQNPALRRYWKRQANSIRKLVQGFSTSEFANLLGHTGETMFDQALPWFGFMPTAKNVRSYKGKIWTQTRDGSGSHF